MHAPELGSIVRKLTMSAVEINVYTATGIEKQNVSSGNATHLGCTTQHPAFKYFTAMHYRVGSKRNGLALDAQVSTFLIVVCSLLNL